MLDAAVIHRAKRHRVAEVARAHDAVEVAHHDAGMAAIGVYAVRGDRDRRHQHRGGGRGQPPAHLRRADKKQRRARHQRDLDLEVAGENVRGCDTHQQCAERAAHRDHQVEIRQVARTGLEQIELPVTEHAAHEQACREDRRRRPQRERAAEPRHHGQRHDERREKQRPVVPARVIEAQDESDQVDRQRHHPQERDRGDVLRQVVGDGKQQARAHGCEGDPQQPVPPRGRAGGGLLCLRRVALRARLHGMPGTGNGGGRAQHDEHGVGRRPRVGLHGKRQKRFDRDGVRQQREQRREVRQRKQAVRHCMPEALPEPRLYQRTGCGQQEVRQADGRAKEAQYQQRRPGVALAPRLPARVGDDRQQQQARREQRHVQRGLAPPGEKARRPVGVGVAAEQRRLEKHEAGRPHRGCPAEPRQDLLGDDGLHQEEQKSAEENRRGVQVHGCG